MTTERQKEKEYKVGDTVWYLAGFIAVRCTILEIEDCFRKKHPAAYLFYWLDEPVGHAVGADDLYDTREEAEAALREAVTDGDRREAAIPHTLEGFRKHMFAFIKSTHLTAAATDEQRRAVEDDWAARRYPEKQRGEEWFAPRDIGCDTQYKVGDAVWHIASRNGVALAIRCAVRAVDDEQFHRDPIGGIMFYDLDEPLASTVSADELFDSREDAAWELKFQAEEDWRIAESRGGLDEFRAGCKGEYPAKKHLEEWFGPADVPVIQDEENNKAQNQTP